jgi:hypothetical protein
MVRWRRRGTVAVADPRDPSQLPWRRKDRSSFSRHLVIDARCHCGRIHPHRRVGKDTGVFTGAVGHPASIRDYFELAWLTCSLAMTGGALGAALETEDAVREAAYVRRSDKQTEKAETV